MPPQFVAGLDLGSTGVKVLVADETGVEMFVEQVATPWRPGAGGATDLDGATLIKSIGELLDSASRRLVECTGDPAAAVSALAISGMGETGFLVDDGGRTIAPGIAWFDPRGQEQVDAMPAVLRDEFAGRTGLPLGVQVSVVKLLALRDSGIPLHKARWFNLPEFVAFSMGGRAASDYSLTSRTGLLDQDTGQPWPELLEYLGVGAGFLPPLVDAGTDLGSATADWVAPAFTGTRLTVAGHDHLVSSVSGGAVADKRYHSSMGTAEVLLRVLDAPLSIAARSRLADKLINCVRHVVPGQFVLVAGVKTGLLMRRALQMCGVSDRAGRDRLDAAVMALPVGGALTEGAIEVRGARNDDGVLAVTVRSDGISPAELFAAVLRHGNEEIQILMDAMDREVPPATSTVLTGGWADMESVQRARSLVLPEIVVSTRSQDTSYGAVMFAARLISQQVTEPIH